jgi:hypothetical protein
MSKKFLLEAFSRLPGRLQGIIIYWYKLFRFLPRNIKAGVLTLLLGDRKITDLNAFEQRYYSQNGEDGILKILFRRIGTTNKHCVEFGISPRWGLRYRSRATEGNSVYLSKNGWKCLWMDGKGDGTRVKKEIITAENINTLFKKYDVPAEFDLLSIDIDSNDYWVWKAIEGYSPRIVVVEYNASVPPTESKSVAYDPLLQWDGTNYFGASLLAFQRLGAARGYTLLVCDESGTNAFFIRNDLLKDDFDVKDIRDIYKPPAYGHIVEGRHIGHPASTRSMMPV